MLNKKVTRKEYLGLIGGILLFTIFMPKKFIEEEIYRLNNNAYVKTEGGKIRAYIGNKLIMEIK